MPGTEPSRFWRVPEGLTRIDPHAGAVLGTVAHAGSVAARDPVRRSRNSGCSANTIGRRAQRVNAKDQKIRMRRYGAKKDPLRIDRAPSTACRAAKP